MALSNILPAFAQRLQLVGKTSPAAARAWMSSSASKAGQEEVYVYQSPGSSIHDPALTGHSLSNPVYVYDPKPPAGQAARSGVTTQPIQAASKATPSTVRPTAAYAAQQVQQQQRADAEATYVYTPPGSSMSSPSYGVSVKDPVYVVDPAPSATTAAAKHSNNAQQQQQQQQKVASAPPANRKRVGLPTDDLASVPYVASTRGSMHEPRYVSVSDPQDRK